MRNKFEERVAAHLGDAYKYESLKLAYIVPARKASYTPDFIDHANKHIVESKGYWRAEDRKRFLLIKEQNPDWRFTMLFQDPNKKINKGSKTSYADFCAKHGIEWAALPKAPTRKTPRKGSSG